MTKNSGRGLFGAAILLAGMLFVGCRSNDYKYNPLATAPAPTKVAQRANEDSDPRAGVSGMLHVGDKITVSFQDLTSPIAPIAQTIKDDGTITLIYNKQFKVAGRTVGDVEKEIHDAYVPAYFVNMTVNVATEERFYFVGGEVRSPNRQVYTGRITVTGAIDTAGGFTEFANKRKIHVTRANGKKFTVNYNKAVENPKENPEIFPNDQVYVPKRIF